MSRRIAQHFLRYGRAYPEPSKNIVFEGFFRESSRVLNPSNKRLHGLNCFSTYHRTIAHPTTTFFLHPRHQGAVAFFLISAATIGMVYVNREEKQDVDLKEKEDYIEPGITINRFTREKSQSSESTLELAITDYLQAENNKVLLIKGESGVGKTKALQYMIDSLKKQGIETHLIELCTYDMASVSQGISDALEKDAGWGKKTKDNKVRICILDGYDELRNTDNRYSKNLYFGDESYGFKEWDNVRFIITCRNGIFESSGGHANFMPKKIEDYIVWEINPFKKEQQDQYIERHVAADPNIHLDEVNRIMRLIPNELKANPLLLKFSLIGIHELKDLIPTDSTDFKIEIYKAFTKRYFLQEAEKQKQSSSTDNMDELSEQYRRYAEDLALGFWALSTKRLSAKVKSAWTEDLLKRKDKQKHSLLESKNDETSFRHNSLQEYFAASGIARLLLEEDSDENRVELQKKLENIGLTPPIVFSDQAILEFLNDLQLTNKINSKKSRKMLEKHVLATRDSPQDISTLGAICITLLNYARENFSHRDYHGIKVPHAVLSNALLYGTNLKDANLAYVTLNKAYLATACLDGAYLQGIDFGQDREYVVEHKQDEKNEPEKVIYSDNSAISPDGKILAIGLSNGDIIFYEIDTNKCIGKKYSLNNTSGAITRLVYRPDGKQLASLHADGSVQRWNSQDTTSVCAKDAVEKPCELLFDPEGGLAIGTTNGEIQYYDSTDETSFRLWSSDSGSVRRMAFSADGQLAAVFEKGGLQIWDTKNNQRYVLHREPMEVLHLEYSPDNQLGILYQNQGDFPRLEVWDPVSRKGILLPMLTDVGLFLPLYFTFVRGKICYLSQNNRTGFYLSVWDLKSGKLEKREAIRLPLVTRAVLDNDLKKNGFLNISKNIALHFDQNQQISVLLFLGYYFYQQPRKIDHSLKHDNQSSLRIPGFQEIRHVENGKNSLIISKHPINGLSLSEDSEVKFVLWALDRDGGIKPVVYEYDLDNSKSVYLDDLLDTLCKLYERDRKFCLLTGLQSNKLFFLNEKNEIEHCNVKLFARIEKSNLSYQLQVREVRQQDNHIALLTTTGMYLIDLLKEEPIVFFSPNPSFRDFIDNPSFRNFIEQIDLDFSKDSRFIREQIACIDFSKDSRFIREKQVACMDFSKEGSFIYAYNTDGIQNCLEIELKTGKVINNGTPEFFGKSKIIDLRLGPDGKGAMKIRDRAEDACDFLLMSSLPESGEAKPDKLYLSQSDDRSSICYKVLVDGQTQEDIIPLQSIHELNEQKLSELDPQELLRQFNSAKSSILKITSERDHTPADITYLLTMCGDEDNDPKKIPTTGTSLFEFSPKGQLLLVDNASSQISILDFDNNASDAFYHPERVTSLAWVSNELLLTGTDLGILRQWKLVELSPGKFSYHLEWASGQQQLCLNRCSIQGVKGLSRNNYLLLYQMGAQGVPFIGQSLDQEAPLIDNPILQNNGKPWKKHTTSVKNDNASYVVEYKKIDTILAQTMFDNFFDILNKRLSFTPGCLYVRIHIQLERMSKELKKEQRKNLITQAFYEALDSVSQLKEDVIYLDISGNELDDIDMQAMYTACRDMKYMKLEAIDISDNHVSNLNGVLAFAEHSNIKQINLSKNRIHCTSDIIEHQLAPWIEKTGCVYLDLSCNYIPQGALPKSDNTNRLVYYTAQGLRGLYPEIYKKYDCNCYFFRASPVVKSNIHGSHQSLFSEDTDHKIDETYGVVTLFANRTGGNPFKEHTFLVIEGVTSEKECFQKFLLLAELSTIDKRMAKIRLENVSPEYLLQRTQKGDDVYCRTFRTENTKIHALLEEAQRCRFTQEKYDYALLPSRKCGEGVINCHKWAIELLATAEIAEMRDKTDVPSVGVNRSPSRCGIM